MAIRAVVTRGYGNGTFDGSIAEAVLRGYGIGEESATQAARKGGAGGRNRKRRKFVLDGQVIEATAYEERQIVAKFIEQQEQQLETAEPQYRRVIKARITKAKKRIETIEASPRYGKLKRDDEDILELLVTLH